MNEFEYEIGDTIGREFEITDREMTDGEATYVVERKSDIGWWSFDVGDLVVSPIGAVFLVVWRDAAESGGRKYVLESNNGDRVDAPAEIVEHHYGRVVF